MPVPGTGSSDEPPAVSDVERLLMEIKAQQGRQDEALGAMGKELAKVLKFSEGTSEKAKRIEAAIGKPFTAQFTPEPEFLETLTRRNGEEIRASMREIANEMKSMLREDLGKALAENKPASNGLMMFFSALGAACAAAQIGLTIYAARNYVPPEFSVNGVKVDESNSTRTLHPVRRVA